MCVSVRVCSCEHAYSVVLIRGISDEATESKSSHNVRLQVSVVLTVVQSPIASASARMDAFRKVASSDDLTDVSHLFVIF